jgi:hypothetical protein
MIRITTIDEVIEALGGPNEISKLLDCRPHAVSMWKARGRISPDTYVILNAALKARGKIAPPHLWGMKVPRRIRKSRAVS